MSGRHQPIAGADSEPVHRDDTFCDQCAKTVYVGRLYAYQGKWLCATCAVRLSGEPACSYCESPTFGDYRRISRSGTVTNACNVCVSKWAADDPVPEEATFAEWQDWLGWKAS